MATSKAGRAPSLEIVGMTKRFGPLVALDDVSIAVSAGSVHALLGENGAGKSTLAKCIMGFQAADTGTVRLDGAEIAIANPREARANGIGMVHQHFTLAPSLTAVENLVVNRPDAPAIINWGAERRRLEAFLDNMPFRVPLDRPVAELATGEKQKLEILKLLYLDQRLLILDEPTSVLTPGDADEILRLLKARAQRGDITVVVITHKLREVAAFADAVTVLRRGRRVGGGKVGELTTPDLARLMIGDTPVREAASRKPPPQGEVVLELSGLCAENAEGQRVIDALDLSVHAGEIVGIAGVSGNGQSELVEVLFGQRKLGGGGIVIRGERFEPTRRDFDRFKVFGLPEEPRRNAVVPRMTIAENMALRSYDKPPLSRGWWLSTARMRESARQLIKAYGIKTSSTESPIETSSGGNVQRAVLARELSGDVDILIVANPCAGLDIAAVAEIRARIVELRDRGAAVLLVSDDLDEILELADRVAVMSGGKVSYITSAAQADRDTIARRMAGA